MAAKPRKRASKQLPGDTERAPTPIEGGPGRRRRNTTATPRTQPGQLIDFAGAAVRAADRVERVNRFKQQVETGTYRADALETARAMERRSDA